MMMRSLVALSLIVVVGGMSISHMSPADSMVAELIDDDPTLDEEPNLAQVAEKKKNAQPEPEYDDSGLPIQRHDPNVEYGYVGEWGSTDKVGSIASEAGAADAQPSDASFLEVGETLQAELVDSLTDDDNDAIISTMEASQRTVERTVPFHTTYAAAMAKYEKKFREHFPQPPTMPYRFQEDFSTQNAKAGQKFTQDGQDYVWVPVQRKHLDSVMSLVQSSSSTSSSKPAAEPASSMRFAQVRSKVSVGEGADLSEDGYLPFDAVTPATLAAAGSNPADAWSNIFGRRAEMMNNGMEAIGSSGPSYLLTGQAPAYGGGLYAGGLQAPPPPPRPDNLPPPPYIRPVPQPEGA